jgi:hypothetical protein
VRTLRRERTIERAERRLEALRTRRCEIVQGEVRAIMLSLRDQSARTRQRLDRELERMAPLEREWERLRSMFEALERTLEDPGVEDLAGHWRGTLEIPDFPVTERQGYIKPFPPRAILF